MKAHAAINANTLVGQSARMRTVHRMVEKLGRGRWPALLLGETGTGKEVIAKQIYNINPVGPFVTIDCSSFVGPLMESELFGHAKGSFTGAHAAKVGLIEHANGGTAFFDEIGEMPLDLQAKLLRVLQQKEFRPVGSLQTKHSDFRIIAATNRDLAGEVEKGTFRRDLYYRLNVVNVRIPALRERREDIPALLNHFLMRYGSHYSLTQETMEALLSYDWQGNVRELENTVQHMIAMNTGPLLHVMDLPSPIQNHLAQKRAHMTMAAASVGGGSGMAFGAAAGAASFAPLAFGAAAGSAGAAVGYAGCIQVIPGSDSGRQRGPAPVESMLGPGQVISLVEMERRAISHALEFSLFGGQLIVFYIGDDLNGPIISPMMIVT